MSKPTDDFLKKPVPWRFVMGELLTTLKDMKKGIEDGAEARALALEARIDGMAARVSEVEQRQITVPAGASRYCPCGVRGP